MKIINSIPSKIIKNNTSNKYFLYVRLTNVLNNILNLYFVMSNKLKNDDIDYFILGLYSINNEEDLKEYLYSNDYDIIIGNDFFVDTSIFIDLGDEVKVNEYILSDIVISHDYTPISNDIRLINYYIYKNNKEEIDEESLLNFNQTFMKIILNNTNIDFSTFDPINTLYKYVIEYYANGGVDNATILMNSIFNTTLTTSSPNTSCGCAQQSSCVNNASASINTGTQIINIDEATCLDKYKAAMYQWLIKMLSDTEFYCCWMIDEEEELEIPNDALIDQLIDLLLALLKSDFDLSKLGTSSTTCGCHTFNKRKGKHWDYVHNLEYGPDNSSNGSSSNSNDSSNSSNKDCSDLTINSGIAGCSNYSIIENYIKVLQWVKNNEIDENKNKIYIYGKQFAEIFPLLKFL